MLIPDIDEMIGGLVVVAVVIADVVALGNGWRPSGGVGFFVSQAMTIALAFVALNPYFWCGWPRDRRLVAGLAAATTVLCFLLS